MQQTGKNILTTLICDEAFSFMFDKDFGDVFIRNDKGNWKYIEKCPTNIRSIKALERYIETLALWDIEGMLDRKSKHSKDIMAF